MSAHDSMLNLYAYLAILFGVWAIWYLGRDLSEILREVRFNETTT